VKIIKYQITTESPIILSESGGISFLSNTKDFIPGSVIRGMFSKKFIEAKALGSKAHDNQEFVSLFLTNNVSYGNAYIATRDNQLGFKENWPLPLSLQHDKDDENQVIDLLLESRGERNIEQTKPFNKYGRIEGDKLFLEDVKKQLFFHHQRNRATGAPKEGLFFNYESLSPGQTFMGDIRFQDDTSADKADKFARLFKECKTFFIGRSRNSQYGRINLELTDLKSWEQPEIKFIDDSRLVLTFVSDAIIVDEYGQFCTDLTSVESYLQKKSGITNIKVEKAFLRIKEIENYVSIWKLRRPTDVSLKAGSCLLIKAEGDDNNKNIVKDFLNNQSFLGLGERRIEGFGRYLLNWQKGNLKLGNNIESPLQTQETISEDHSNSALSASSLSIIREIVKNRLKETTILLAQQDAEKFNLKSLKEASKSSLGRLEKAFDEFRFQEEVKNFLDSSTTKYKNSLAKISCSLGNTKNLLKFVETPLNLDTKIKDFLQELSQTSLLNLVNELNLTGPNSGFIKELEELYFKTLLYALRQRQRLNRGEIHEQ